VQDAAAMVRDYIKWDDLPISLPHFAESAVRAYKIAMTPPTMPVLLVARRRTAGSVPWPADAGLRIPSSPWRASAGDSAAVARLPITGRRRESCDGSDRAARTPAGLAYLVELAELLQAPVVDQPGA